MTDTATLQPLADGGFRFALYGEWTLPLGDKPQKKAAHGRVTR